ncbi:MAG: alpha-L-arabinofuranosidase C-terminal domain-containing protein [Balneolaceae bacterium]
MKKLIAGTAILFLSGFMAASAQNNSLIIHADEVESTISKHIYGQFSEHLGTGLYGGIWVGQDSDIPNQEGYRTDVLEALQELEIPNLRWPGGCFADEYHWRDGIGPRDERPARVNTHWGMVLEDNSFGTHEFMRLAELLDTEPYLAVNVGSGTAREMAEWIEYLTFAGESTLAEERRENGREEPWNLEFVGIGNESWGCGGNMRPEFYADLYRQYATFAKDYSGNQLYKIASGFADVQYDWTETLMERAGPFMDALSLHYYTIPTGDWGNKGPSIDFDEDMYFASLKQGLRIDEFITRHKTRMDKHDPGKRVALAVDEWGIWTDPLPGTNPGYLQQQNSLRDALVASTTLDILNKHSDRVRIGNIAQTVNVLQAMIITEGDQMIKTPTYHVFEMYRVHYDAELLATHLQNDTYEFNGEEIPAISTTVSKNEEGIIHLTMTNLHATESQEVEVDIRGASISSISEGRILTADEVDAINTFEDSENVSPQNFGDYNLSGEVLTIQIPAKSLIVLRLN